MESIQETKKAGKQIEHLIAKQDWPAVLPQVAAKLFPSLLEPTLPRDALGETIAAEPVLAARLFSLANSKGLSADKSNYSVRSLLSKLTDQTVRDAFLSLKVAWEPAEPHEQDPSYEPKEHIIHSIAVACCAHEIAQLCQDQVSGQLAYFAGLMHDIGKFALAEMMPKSFARILSEAKLQQCNFSDLERKYLGIDHALIGKRLAQKWALPEPLTVAVWLHHSETAVISERIPEAKIAQIVQLADLTARQCGIGQSGSYDKPQAVNEIAQSLGMTPKDLEQIGKELPEQVQAKVEALGLSELQSLTGFCEKMLRLAVRQNKDNSKLIEETAAMHTASSQLDFIDGLLSRLRSLPSPISVGQELAVRWQRFYQTGNVCLYLLPRRGTTNIEAVIVQSLGQSKTFLLAPPATAPPIPGQIAEDFAILDASECVDWLFEQLDTEFDRGQTKILPLLSGPEAVGALVFELRYPADVELFEQNFKKTACIAATLLETAVRRNHQQDLAEQFAEIVGPAKKTEQETPQQDLLGNLAEMVAGIAHELNNPLAVISGQSQLLADGAIDPQNKQSLQKIQQNCGELSSIVTGLMSFAKPQQPRRQQSDVKQMLEEAGQLAAQKTSLEKLNIEISVAQDLQEVFVDSGQIVSALANILANSVEAYDAQTGPITVAATKQTHPNSVKLQISDRGCGMDDDTVSKATLPFYSAKPAGRKRGMGLAYAARLIELNNGSIKIESRLGEGTTVTVLLPCD